MLNRPSRVLFGTIQTGIDVWPSYVDILTIVLMVFILQGFLQNFVNPEVFELARLRQTQERLKQSLLEEFRDETAAGKIVFDASPNLLQIRFTEEVLFAKGKHDLAAEGAVVLGRCARVLRAAGVVPYEQLQVEGHADSQTKGGLEYPRNNWELSTARALTVVQKMIDEGIDPVKLSANGYGPFRPIASNSTEPGRRLNRRIELRIVFSTPKRNLKEAR